MIPSGGATMKETKPYEKLKEVRKKNSMSYEETAKLAGFSKTFYWQIENRKRRLTYENAVKIANVFHLKPDDIFYEEQLLISNI